MNTKKRLVLIIPIVLILIAVLGYNMFRFPTMFRKLKDESLSEEKVAALVDEIKAKEDIKVMVAYFSHSGNTKIMAEEIASQTNGDLFEIKTDKEYSDLNNEVKEEIANNERHNLLKKVNNIDEYDVVFVGYPVWWHSTPVQINTFLEAHNLEGKVVIPFCTSGGSDISETMDSFKNSCKNCAVLDGITISGSSASTDSEKEKITAWLKKLGIFE